MNFTPEEKTEAKDVPFFDDVIGSDGWEGHGTGKSTERLQQEVSTVIVRLGGHVTGFQRGSYGEREGLRIEYIVKADDGRFVPGRIDIAALPVRVTNRNRQSAKKRREKSFRMALYMLNTALKGTWFLQQLSPGYAALMPWMLVDGEKTISQAWANSPIMNSLLPPGDSEFIDAEYRDEA